MILEAAKRSAGSGNPIPYMNKILSDWKHTGVMAPGNIPERASVTKPSYVNPAVEAVNAKADRERYYALLRERAQSVADKYVAKANSNSRFKEISTELSRMEIALAKAEVFEPENCPNSRKSNRSLRRIAPISLKAWEYPKVG